MPRLFSVLSVCVAVVLGAGSLWLLAGCGGSSSDSDAAPKQDPVEARLIAQGREIFGERCQECHAIEGRPRRGTTGEYGPSLDEVKPKRSYIAYRIEWGGPGMGAFSDVLSEVEKLAVTTYLLDVAGRNVPTRPVGTAADIAAGERAFGRYCNSCHTIGDRRATGRFVWHGTNFNNVSVSPERAQWMVDRGDFWMPSQYDNVPRTAVHDIIAYIVSASGRGPDVYEEPR